MPALVAIDLVELGHVGRQALALHDRQADPDQRNFLVAEQIGDRLDPRGIEFLPARRLQIGGAGTVADLLAVVAADHHHRNIDLVGAGDEVMGRLDPVEVIVADETAVFARLAQDDDFRLVGESFAQPLGEQLAQTVAHRRLRRH